MAEHLLTMDIVMPGNNDCGDKGYYRNSEISFHGYLTWVGVEVSLYLIQLVHTYKGHTKLHFPCAWFENVAGVRYEWKSLLLTLDDWLVTCPVESGEVCQENMSTLWLWFTLLALSSFAAWFPCLFQVLSL